MQFSIILFLIFYVLSPAIILGQELPTSDNCEKCHNIFNKYKNVNSAIYEKEFTKLFLEICKQIANNAPLCFVTLASQNPIVYTFLAKIKPDQICAIIVENCGQLPEPIREDIELPPKPKRKRPVDKCVPGHGNTFRFVQISDTHIQYKYAVGSEADCCRIPLQCGVNDCCVDMPIAGQKAKFPAEYWGTLAACDIPYRTAELLFEHLRDGGQEFDFGLLSGDYASHRALTYTQEGHKELIANLSALISQYLPEKPFYWTLGNHEGVPINQFAPHYVKLPPLRPQWVYEAVWKAGSKFLPESTRISAIYRGSYSAYIRPKLKLISLHTGYCIKSNFWMYLAKSDPDGTFAWLINELTKVEARGHYAYILGHIPPGFLESLWYDECFDSWSRNYAKIVDRFSSIISGQFFGHHHPDSFKMFFESIGDPKSVPSSVMYLGPSLTTSAGLNPAYRIYTADAETGQIVDFETHFLNLTKANQMAIEEKPSWELLYSAKSEYGLSDLSPASWNQLIGRIESDQNVRQKFVRNFFRRDDRSCDSKCMQQLVCSLRVAHTANPSFCEQSIEFN